MNTPTYDSLPPDIRAAFGPDDVTIDESIPTGQVDVHTGATVTRMPVNAFVRTRRKARKAERQRRKGGR